MPASLLASLPAVDPVQRLLFSGEGGLFPGGHFQSAEAVERRLAHLDRVRSEPAQVAGLLREENAFADLSAEQQASLAAAASPQAVFVMTGQQPGLLGGPVLWYYKALTCAALARQAAAYLGRPVVPIFWVAGDDSDLRECSHVELLETPPDGPSVLHLPFAEAARPIPVGARPIEAPALEALFAALSRVWAPATVAAARRCYLPGATLADGFLRLAQERLAAEGILFVNGFSPRLRALGRPVLLRAAREWRRAEAALKGGTAALRAAGLKRQVPLRPGVVHAFALRDGERHRLFAEAAPGGGDRLYLADHPHRDLSPESLELTHDVFTRPLVAEAALPVLGHVLGPAELRYFAQMAPLFQDMTGDMPLAHPRMSVVAAPEAMLRAFAAAGVSTEELAVLKPSGLRGRLSAQAWGSHPAARSLPAGPAEAWLPSLRPVHAKHFADPGPLERLERSLRAAWKRYHESLERMAYAAGPSPGRGPSADPRSASGRGDGRDEALFRGLRWLGNGMGQDRHLNLFSLVEALGGEAGLAELMRAADPVLPGAQVIAYGG